MGHSPLLQRPKAFLTELLVSVSVWGISHRFQWLSPSEGQVSHVLLTRAPLSPLLLRITFDLHVLGTPPTFILSQDQTLRIYFHASPLRPAPLFLRVLLALASCHYAVVKVPQNSDNKTGFRRSQTSTRLVTSTVVFTSCLVPPGLYRINPLESVSIPLSSNY